MPDPDCTAAVTPTGSQTVLESEASAGGAPPAVLKLKLKKPRPSRRVQWSEETIDNEHMNKKVRVIDGDGGMGKAKKIRTHSRTQMDTDERADAQRKALKRTLAQTDTNPGR